MKELDDDLLRKIFQSFPEDSPSEGFVDKIMQRIEIKNIFVRIWNWIVEKQSSLILKMTYSVINNTQRLIKDYNEMITLDVAT
jgi:hypothetical protein